ncbi:MAG: hypothetical protein R3C62_08580 [Chloroflexota bacterium]
MRRLILLLLLFVLLLVTPTAVRYLKFYQLGGATERTVPTYDPLAIAPVPTPEAGNFVDEPEMGDGVVLLDMAHGNQFTLNEISFLDGRLAARGFDLLPFDGGDLATTLRSANALVVIAPVQDYSEDELLAVRNFVNRGGRLLMVGDPARFNIAFAEDPLFGFTVALETDKLPLNSLANAFDIVFTGDYLYNTLENEGNFRNIIVQEKSLAEDALTADVGKLAFYGTHSLQLGASATPLLQGDDNTWSSATDRAGGLTLAASSAEGHVVAVGDVNFLTAPYYAVYDNGRFIAHLADFLTDTAGRGLVLGDFPYFYQTAVNLTYLGDPELGAGAFDEIIALQDAFGRVGQTLTLADAPTAGADALYVGLYSQADEVADLLAEAGVTLIIDPPLTAEVETAEIGGDVVEPPAETIRLIQSDLGNVQMAGTALLLLAEHDGQRSVIVLAASGQGLENVLYRLIDLIPLNADYALSDCLLQGNVALCPTQIGAEPVEAVLDTSTDTSPPPDSGGEPPLPSGETVDQGEIGLGETKTAVLQTAEIHSWVYSQGPGFIDISVESADFDAILEILDPSGQTLDYSDRGFTGDGEQLTGVEIPDADDYTILVSAYGDGSGSYTLTVSEGEPRTGANINTILLFGDDNGESLAGGNLSVEQLATLLGGSYQVTTWVASQDGALTEEALAGQDLLIWDSGDYRQSDGFADPSVEVIFQYLDGGGHMVVMGASPPLFGAIDLAPLADVELIGDDPLLTNGFTPGEVIELTQTIDAAASEMLEPSANEHLFLQRGPGSDQPGGPVALAALDEFGGNRTVFLLLPFFALPETVQPLLLDNMIGWIKGGF